jgi:hypothetical protein
MIATSVVSVTAFLFFAVALPESLSSEITLGESEACFALPRSRP